MTCIGVAVSRMGSSGSTSSDDSASRRQGEVEMQHMGDVLMGRPPSLPDLTYYAGEKGGMTLAIIPRT